MDITAECHIVRNTRSSCQTVHAEDAQNTPSQLIMVSTAELTIATVTKNSKRMVPAFQQGAHQISLNGILPMIIATHALNTQDQIMREQNV